MFVSTLIDDLTTALHDFPAAARWRIGVATYTDGPGSDIDVMYAASFHTEQDDAFFLVPEGMGETFALQESAFSVQDLLQALTDHPAWATHRAFVHAALVDLPDGSTESSNFPLWGTGVHEQAQLVYFYYGAAEPDTE